MKNLKELVSIKSKRFWEAPFGPIWALPRPPPLCQTGKRGKKCSKPSWQAFTPPPLGQCPYGKNSLSSIFLNQQIIMINRLDDTAPLPIPPFLIFVGHWRSSGCLLNPVHRLFVLVHLSSPLVHLGSMELA